MLEKNHQVGLMSQIYSQALITVIWLGPGDEGSNRAIDLLDDSSCDAWTLCYVANNEDDLELYGNMSEEMPLEHCKEVLDIWPRNCYKRMWVIQELVMNKSLSLFMCGTRQFSRAQILGVSFGPNPTLE